MASSSARVLQAAPTAGRCIDCGTLVWRSTRHPVEASTIILWPDPTTLYAQVSCLVGTIVGICYCSECCPQVGAPCHADTMMLRPDATTITGIDTAWDRYAYWFTRTYGEWLRAWLSDELHLDEPEKDTLLAQWEADAQVARKNRLTDA